MSEIDVNRMFLKTGRMVCHVIFKRDFVCHYPTKLALSPWKQN